MGMIKDDTVRNATSYYWGERRDFRVISHGQSTLFAALLLWQLPDPCALPVFVLWCLENYAISNYIAEFWNTLTNVAMITLAVLGIYSSIRHRHGKRVTAMYVGLLLVGVGSACFHATLKYTTQLLDELPMLYLCALCFYSLVEIDVDIKFGKRLPIALALFQTGITLIYVFWMQNPAFHQVAFGVTAVGAIVFGTKRFSELNIGSETRRTLSRLHLMGHLGMWGGFLVWNVDNIFCHQLRTYRSYLGMPLDGLLQLHGWWHIMTAYGSVYLLLWAHLLKLARLGHDTMFSIQYFMGIFPHVALNNPKKVD
ncbi:alkaline ceramidase ydc1 [Coemansia sp. RSA 788]|nr:alkaline ceramidase ydc1 [Coemansia sp. RSA 788]